jgi:hypothetical protein
MWSKQYWRSTDYAKPSHSHRGFSAVIKEGFSSLNRFNGLPGGGETVETVEANHPTSVVTGLKPR